MTTSIARLARPCPRSVNPVQWSQSVGIARQACARIFRDGGTPAEALAAFGIDVGDAGSAAADWALAVDSIAEVLCSRPVRRAA